MSKKLIFSLIIMVVLISGCSLWPQPKPGTNQTTQPANKNTVANQNQPPKEEATAKNILKEIADPKLELPKEISPKQIQFYFQYNEDKYALVLQPSLNVELILPVDFKTTFVGVLKAKKGETKWTKNLEIQDTTATDKNNPYYLWLEKEVLTLSVVDQTGAQKGDGTMKTYELSADGTWVLNGCYNYTNYSSEKPSLKDYLLSSQYLNRMQRFRETHCENIKIINL